MKPNLTRPFAVFALLFSMLLIQNSAQAATDGEIMKILSNANDAEIDAAKVAKSRSGNDQVKQFAEKMISAHKDNMKKGKDLAKNTDIKMKDSDAAKELKKQSKDKLSQLKKENEDHFTLAYVQSQVEMHQDLLTKLDSEYIPTAQNPQLKQFLTETRSHVNEHLEEVKAIQKGLMK